MVDAQFRHGSPEMIDYTPGSGNIAAGDVVLLGNLVGLTCGIAHQDIENTKLGSLAVGGGVYEVEPDANIAAYQILYWDAANNVVTETTTNMARFGYSVEALVVNTTGLAKHKPYEDT